MQNSVLDKRFLVKIFLNSFVCCLIPPGHSRRRKLPCASFSFEILNRNI